MFPFHSPNNIPKLEISDIFWLKGVKYFLEKAPSLFDWVLNTVQERPLWTNTCSKSTTSFECLLLL